MTRLGPFAAVTALILSVPARAQPTIPVPQPPALAIDPPATLMGNPCRRSDIPGGDNKVAICIGPNFMTAGIAGVTVSTAEPATYEQLVEQMRESFHESGSLRVISEERFVPASAPDAVGLRGEYVTGTTGRKFVWSVYRDGAFTRVLVTVMGQGDRTKIEPEILHKVFGPDRYPARVSEPTKESAQ